MLAVVTVPAVGVYDDACHGMLFEEDAVRWAQVLQLVWRLVVEIELNEGKSLWKYRHPANLLETPDNKELRKGTHGGLRE